MRRVVVLSVVAYIVVAPFYNRPHGSLRVCMRDEKTWGKMENMAATERYLRIVTHKPAERITKCPTMYKITNNVRHDLLLLTLCGSLWYQF